MYICSSESAAPGYVMPHPTTIETEKLGRGVSKHLLATLPFIRAMLILALLCLLTVPALAQPVTMPPTAASLRSALLQPAPPILSISSQRIGLRSETAFPPIAFNAPPRDPWLGFDKVQHLTVSFLWTLGTQYALVNKVSLRERQALPFSIGSSAIAGVGKEWYDLHHGRRYFSRRDLVADAIGILLATGVILL